jgi:hypothetical protein
MIIVHTINLEHREDRRASFNQEALVQGFKPKFWSGIYDRKNPKRGICKSHKQIIQFAKDNHLASIIVAEDDCKFTDREAFDYYLEKTPTDFDLYLGMTYVAEYKGNRVVNGMSGSHTLYTVHERFYDFYLSIPDDVHIDRYLGQFAWKYKYLTCYPMVVQQTGGYSDNLKRTMSYGGFHRKLEFYKRK